MISLGATEKPCMKSKNHLVYFEYISIISGLYEKFLLTSFSHKI
jgi:hypothetical protein